MLAQHQYEFCSWVVYGEEPATYTTGQSDGSIKDSDQVAYTAQDIRFTQNGKALSVFLLVWPAESYTAVAVCGCVFCNS